MLVPQLDCILIGMSNFDTDCVEAQINRRPINTSTGDRAPLYRAFGLPSKQTSADERADIRSEATLEGIGCREACIHRLLSFRA